MFLTMDMAKGLLGRTTGAVVAAGVLLVLAGCRDGDGGDGTKDAGAAVIAPGRPGEKARTLSPEEAAGRQPDDSPNAADRTYVQHMVEHHRQALTMSALAPERASAEGVKRLAERISAAQQPEIGSMEKWLARHPAPAGAPSEARPATTTARCRAWRPSSNWHGSPRRRAPSSTGSSSP